MQLWCMLHYTRSAAYCQRHTVLVILKNDEKLKNDGQSWIRNVVSLLALKIRAPRGAGCQL